MRPRMTLLSVGLVLLLWLSLSASAPEAELPLPNGQCEDDSPPICPFCTGHLWEDCDKHAYMASCESSRDTCVTSETYDVRGTLQSVTKGCKRPESCTEIVNGSPVKTKCTSEQGTGHVTCVTCNDDMKTCPPRPASLYQTVWFGLLAGAGVAVLVVVLVGAIKAYRDRRESTTYVITSTSRRLPLPTGSKRPRYSLFA